MIKLPSSARHWSKWSLFFTLWTLVALSFATQLYLGSSKAGRPLSWNQALGFALGDWYVYALLSIPVIKLGRRFPFSRHRWGSVALLHLFASLVFSFVYILLRAWVAQVQGAWGGAQINFGSALALLVKTFQYNLWVYWVILAVAHAFDFYQQLHERELRASDLEKRLTQARLHTLQSQLNPHFLFNTLHTISALMHKDIEAADRMIVKLSELLRAALESSEKHEVLLREELNFLERYLEIEQTRFRDRLAIEKEIQPEVLNGYVPNLILQPLLENAIRHGIEPHARRGKIILRALREDGKIRLEVEDNGPGLSGKKPSREGIGLTNTRRRLEQLYGPEQMFELEPASGGGLLARIIIPFRTSPLPPA